MAWLVCEVCEQCVSDKIKVMYSFVQSLIPNRKSSTLPPLETLSSLLICSSSRSTSKLLSSGQNASIRIHYRVAHRYTYADAQVQEMRILLCFSLLRTQLNTITPSRVLLVSSLITDTDVNLLSYCLYSCTVMQ